MQNWFDLSKEDRLEIIIQTSVSTGLPPAAIEKDWWVVTALRAIFNTEYSNYLVFKGGTSLSKAWNIIERFSEDVDIAIDRDYLGFSGKLSKSQVTRLRKTASKFFSIDFKEKFVNELKKQAVKDFEVKVKDFVDSDTDPITIEIEYKSLTETIPYLKPKILIEGSARSMREPFEEKDIRSFISYKYADKSFADALIKIPTVRPTRTLWEKILLLHEEFQKPKGRVIRTERMTRHLYDISKIMDTPFCEEAMNDKDLFLKIVEHRRTITKISWINYSNHIPAEINFIPPMSIFDEWKKDYAEMQESMFYKKTASFEDMIRKLRILNKKVNKLTF